MNHHDRDPMLDAFLEEALGQVEPPDLSDRIVRAWNESNNGDRLASRQLAQQSELQPAPPVAPPTPPPAPQTVAVDTRRSRGRQTASWPTYVITLAVAIAILTIYLAATNNSDRLANNENPPTPEDFEQLANEGADPAKEVAPEDRRPNGQLATNDNGSAFDETAPFELNKPNGPAADIVERAKAEPISSDTLIATINGRLEQTWAVNSIAPTELATDAEFCRRLFLAMIGRIPTVPELEAFLKRDDENKRRWLVDRLQNHRAYRPYYVANWTNFWTNLLIGRTGGQNDSLANREGLAIYLTNAIDESKPYDELVRELITARGVNQPGDEDFNGAVNFLLDGYTKDTTLAASRTARIFLGRQIQCVQCHNHPKVEGLNQNRFWEFNAFFRQMDVKRSRNGKVALRDRSIKGEAKDDDEAETYYEQLDGRKRVAFPVFFDGQSISKSGDLNTINRRVEVARLITSSPDFSRAAVNRLWARFFQFGLSNPLDDMGDHEAPEHPELLQLLAEQFEAHDYNLDLLIKWIASTDAFGRSSKSIEDNVADNPQQGRPLFSHYYTRQLSPEAVYDSLQLAAKGRQRETGSMETVGDYVQAQRAWVGEFSKNMKTDEGQETNTFSGDIRQSVVVMTSPLMKQAVSNQLGGVLNQVTSSSMSIPEKIEHLFLAALSRKPTKREMIAVRKIIDPRNPNAGLQDIWWALLNSNEFILDH